MLKQRVITACILIPILLAALFFLPLRPFALFMAAFALAAAWEWANLMGIKTNAMRVLYVLIMLAALFNAMFVPVLYILIVALVFWLVATVLVVLYPRAKQVWGKSVVLRGFMGIFVIVPCFFAVTYIRIQSDGLYALLFLFLLIWGADTAAYFVGNRYGKHKLAHAVSPGKSVEGLAGALVFAVVFTMAVLWGLHVPYASWPWSILLAIVTVLFSVVGDLFESMLKRQVGLKDSGRLLPGHGGILDRIDSLTAAAPIFTLGALLMGMYL